jgi:hypothetical protein
LLDRWLLSQRLWTLLTRLLLTHATGHHAQVRLEHRQ